MTNFQPFDTLKSRLVFWFTAICLLPLFLMTTIIYFQRVKVARELIFDKLSAVSSLRQQQITGILDNLAKDTATLAMGHSIASSTAGLLARGGIGAGADALPLMRSYRNNYPAVAEVSIVSGQGELLLSTDPGKNGTGSERPETVASALRDLVPTYGEAYLSRGDGIPSLEVAAPIQVAGRGRLPAALVIRYDLRKLLYDFLDNRVGMGQTGETLLVNGDAVALCDLRGNSGSFLKAKLSGKPALLASRGQTGIAETTDYRGQKVLAAYAHIPRTGWGLVCKQDSGEVYAPLTSLLYVTYGIASLIALLVCGLAYRVARSLSLPIRNLSLTAGQIGAGDYGARITPKGTREQRELAASFNAMADALQAKMAAQAGLARISESLVTAEDLPRFFERLLPVLMELTGARMAVAFQDDESGEQFLPVHAVGADQSRMRRFERAALEGELGVVLALGKVSHYLVPEGGESLRLVTSFGEIVPADIMTLPIALDDEIRAFVSLASERPFPPGGHDLLEQARLAIGAGFARVLAGEYVRKLASELAVKNAELTQQSEELLQQSTELAHQSDELTRRNRVLDRQKQELEQATRLKSEFLSNMSHELRTPLNSVLALSRVLSVQGGGRLTEDERGYLAIIERNGKHLLSLINDILDLAKIESGRQDVFYERLPLEKIVRETVDALAPIAIDKGLALTLKSGTGTPAAVTVDGKKLRQILQNLIGNAVKFTAEGSVEVTLRGGDREFEVEIADTGIGIAPGFLDTIFQEFRQADGSTSRSYEGTGLGLAIARKSAQILGGDVTVASEPGRGSVFTLRLPVDGSLPRSGAAEAAVLPMPAAAKPAGQRGRCVLVVDDDPEAVSLIVSRLSLAGYETVTALNGADAIRLARARRPFAITLDIMMPEMDGWEVMRELKGHSDTADIPVIVVSLSGDRETGVALGAIGVIAKPVDGAELLKQFAQLTGEGCRLVLVVDDDEFDRVFIASIFKENGMDVLLAEDGQQALELALADHPDLITLDLMMPGMDGAAVIDKLRAYESTASIPVVVITAKDLSREESARLSEGVGAVLAKGGYDRQALLDELVQSLGRLGVRLPGPLKAHGSRILIVEDSEAATIQLRFALGCEGFSVDAVSGGRHALDYLKTHVPDAIILDLMMPEVDGFAVLKAVRASRLTARVPVMVMTAKTLSPGEHDRLRELEVHHLLQKGDVDQEELLGRVYEMLGTVRVFKAQVETERQVEVEATVERKAENQVKAQGAQAPWRGDGSLLVVEDNPDNLETIRAVLSGQRIVEAVDGEAALVLLATVSPSLILLDMQLPRMDGREVLRRLKADPTTAGIPVVALTASAMAGDRERFIAAGCADYLSKPYEVEELKALVERFI